MKKSFRNVDIDQILIGIPDGHKHLRTVVKTSTGHKMIFQEATIANLVRAYITIKTHPKKKAIELSVKKFKDRKPNYAEYQLIETKREERSIIEELGKDTK